MVERFSRLSAVLKNLGHQSKPVKTGLIDSLPPLPAVVRRSITLDRSTEFYGLVASECRHGFDR